jgi:hypothetical protein
MVPVLCCPAKSSMSAVDPGLHASEGSDLQTHAHVDVCGDDFAAASDPTRDCLELDCKTIIESRRYTRTRQFVMHA